MGNATSLLRLGGLAGGFLAVTVALVVYGTSREAPMPVNDPLGTGVVTRTEAGFDPVKPEPTGALDTAALMQAVQMAQAPAAAPAPAPVDTGLEAMTAGVLAELGAPSSAAGADMRDMTAGVLAGLQGASAAQTEQKAAGLETLVVQALRQGQSDSYIDALLNEAAGRGDIAVPQALITSEGRVDTATLLASLVQKSSGAASGDAAALAAAAGQPVAPREPVKRHVYTVQPGESLGGIAQRIYGDAGYYRVIFDANRDRLITPDRISVGQKLVMPAG